jgi:hypothetical protein
MLVEVAMAAGRTPCLGCQERDRELLLLHRRLAVLNEGYQSLLRENRRVVRRLAKVERLNHELRQRQDEARYEQHRQTQPFRRKKTQAGKHKKPGRPKGHKPAFRPVPTPEQVDRVINVPMHECPTCHVPLCDPAVVVQYQTDLPPIVPIVTQFNIETGFCPCCRQRWQGRHSEQTSDALGAAGNTLGPVVLIRVHRGEWLVFLHDPEVPPTNNHAEQMLRPAVITRKVGGCNKTLWGR